VNTWVSGGDDDGDAVHEEIWCLTAKMQQDNEIGSKCFAYAAGEGIIQFIAVLAGISLHRFAATCIGLQLACRWGRWVAATRKMHHHHLINSKLKFTIFQPCHHGWGRSNYQPCLPTPAAQCCCACWHFGHLVLGAADSVFAGSFGPLFPETPLDVPSDGDAFPRASGNRIAW